MSESARAWTALLLVAVLALQPEPVDQIVEGEAVGVPMQVLVPVPDWIDPDPLPAAPRESATH